MGTAVSRAERRVRARRASVPWRERHDALLAVLNALLLAHGQGPNSVMVVSGAYVGKPRRNVLTEPRPGTFGGFIVYLESVPEASEKEGASSGG